MKTLAIQLIIFCSLFATFSSCSQDKEQPITPIAIENIIGNWDLVSADISYMVDGQKVTDLVTTPNGTMNFREDGQGYADLQLELEEKSYEFVGSFSWQKDNQSMLISFQGQGASRYFNPVNEANLQALLFDTIDPETGRLVEFYLMFQRQQ